MQIDVITLFPELISQCASVGVVGRAQSRSILRLTSWNPRDYSDRRDRRVDERPFGGGPGMVMRIEPLRKCLAAILQANLVAMPHVIYLSPQGQLLNQAKVRELASYEQLIFICGRYEGIDERLILTCVDEEVSIGDYVLSGGELAAAVVIDAVTRCLPGVLGNDASSQSDSFEGELKLVDFPQFTQPFNHEWGVVPAVLRSGHHGKISRWRRQQSLGRTWLRRPELLRLEDLSADDRVLLEEFIAQLTLLADKSTDRDGI